MSQQRFDIHKAPQSPMRAEVRYPISDTGGHIRGVEAISQGLIRSTLKAAGIATAILVVFYLPSEYGTDITGLGSVLGLTEMGQIKQQLSAENAANAVGTPTAASDVAVPADLIARLDRIEMQLASVSTALQSGTVALAAAPLASQPEVGAESMDLTNSMSQGGTDDVSGSAWRDEVSYPLAPGEGIEIKLVMQQGQSANFEWTANGSVVNYQTHGEGSGQNLTYEEGRSVPEQAGELTAAFTGNHGWFWRNRTADPITLTLRTGGQYSEIKRP